MRKIGSSNRTEEHNVNELSFISAHHGSLADCPFDSCLQTRTLNAGVYDVSSLIGRSWAREHKNRSPRIIWKCVYTGCGKISHEDF